MHGLAGRVSKPLCNEICPAAHGTVGTFVANAFGETVSDGHVPNACVTHPFTLVLSSYRTMSAMLDIDAASSFTVVLGG